MQLGMLTNVHGTSEKKGVFKKERDDVGNKGICKVLKIYQSVSK